MKNAMNTRLAIKRPEIMPPSICRYENNRPPMGPYTKKSHTATITHMTAVKMKIIFIGNTWLKTAAILKIVGKSATMIIFTIVNDFLPD
ncbi:MAG: hypothetical protein J6L89_00110 [Clostridia bacterium]|nr:hypothetical protein [Clostridia bacterium]